ncbi:hypothetical protein R5H30_15830 [Sulfitobacter sp. D35]|uniref:NYN domain-containing protein n=1 Tax=Sulfitobacter sp. D35 TaxID=3083252 RepID=UPI00296FF32C|nr:hypothetical protein [Sulfitobacter sp. D35]MDW4499462.1 hypothetical protein [Sulfitobacter sp. D35]
MPVVLLVLAASLAATAIARAVPQYSDLLLLAVPCLVASTILVLRGRARRDSSQDFVSGAILDGSNVMHWKDGVPRIEPVREVARALEQRGILPIVVFDANAGYLLSGRYRHDDDLAKAIGIAPAQVLVVDKGTPADPTILRLARRYGAFVVTRDRYRDWEAEFPEILEPGHLVPGGYRSGRLWLKLPKLAEAETGTRQAA